MRFRERNDVGVVLIANSALETPNYSIKRVRDDEAELAENAATSYQLVEPKEDVGAAFQDARKQPKPEEAAVAGVVPQQPAPAPTRTKTRPKRRRAATPWWRKLFGLGIVRTETQAHRSPGAAPQRALRQSGGAPQARRCAHRRASPQAEPAAIPGQRQRRREAPTAIPGPGLGRRRGGQCAPPPFAPPPLGGRRARFRAARRGTQTLQRRFRAPHRRPARPRPGCCGRAAASRLRRGPPPGRGRVEDRRRPGRAPAAARRVRGRAPGTVCERTRAQPAATAGTARAIRDARARRPRRRGERACKRDRRAATGARHRAGAGREGGRGAAPGPSEPARLRRNAGLAG